MSNDQALHTEDLTARGGGTAQQTITTPPTGRPDSAPQAAEDHASWADLIGETRELSSRWDAIQAGFVDEPRRSVEQADELVARVIQRLAESFAAERSKLEGQWSSGQEVGTEELRVALRRYRTFFRLLLRS
jgi:hypothetical protein